MKLIHYISIISLVLVPMVQAQDLDDDERSVVRDRINYNSEGALNSVSNFMIEDRDGEVIGVARDVVMDPREGRIRYVVVDRSDYSDTANNYYPVPYEHLHFQPDGKAAVINTTRDELTTAPSFNDENRPRAYDQDWQNEVSDYYNENVEEMDRDYESENRDRYERIENRREADQQQTTRQLESTIGNQYILVDPAGNQQQLDEVLGEKVIVLALDPEARAFEDIDYDQEETVFLTLAPANKLNGNNYDRLTERTEPFEEDDMYIVIDRDLSILEEGTLNDRIRETEVDLEPADRRIETQRYILSNIQEKIQGKGRAEKALQNQ